MSKRPDGFYSSAPDLARGLTLAFEFAGAVLLFWLIGRGIDGWLDSAPWAQIVGSLLGWVGGFLHVYYKVKRDSEPTVGQKTAEKDTEADRR